jgi:hypothetical protein
MIVAVMTDLIFQVKIMDVAKRLGKTVSFVKDLATVPEGVETVLLDLSYAGVDPLALIPDLKARGLRTIAFVSHVQVELRRQAEEAGCDVVVARSAFVQRLPELLGNS